MMTENKELTEYLNKVIKVFDDVKISVYDEDNNAEDLSNGIVNVWIERK